MLTFPISFFGAGSVTGLPIMVSLASVGLIELVCAKCIHCIVLKIYALFFDQVILMTAYNLLLSSLPAKTNSAASLSPISTVPGQLAVETECSFRQEWG